MPARVRIPAVLFRGGHHRGPEDFDGIPSGQLRAAHELRVDGGPLVGLGFDQAVRGRDVKKNAQQVLLAY